MINNTVSNNEARDGGGIWLYLREDSDIAFFYNNIVWGNGDFGAALGRDFYINNNGNGNSVASNVNLYNNDFDLSNGFYIEVDDAVVYSDNLDNENPQFDTDGYHLTDISPCIDAGIDAGVYDDIDGDSRPQPEGGDYDIGADEFVPPMIDLDITNCTVTKRVSLSRVKPINIKLAVKNNGEVNGGETCDATVIGQRGGVQVYKETMAVSDQIGKGPTIFQFPDYTPQNEGDIVWTATIYDDDPDVDVAMEITTVKQ